MPSLGNDLATIRENRGLSLDDIQQSTKIPRHVLTAIEDDSIFSGMGSSATYIRSYVRTYARALSIEENKIIHALNRTEKNNYSGSLIDDGRRAEETTKPKNKQKKDSPAKSKKKEDKPSAGSGEKSESAAEDPVLTSKDVNDIDWANMGHQFQQAKNLNSRKGLTIGILLILLVVAVFLIYWFFLRTNSEGLSDTAAGRESPTQTTASPETNQPEAMPLTEGDSVAMNPDAANGRLPDTLSLVVYAAYDKLEPIRIYTDIADELNPYWIEQGEAMAFKFVNSFQFRGELENVILLMNGHRISNLEEQFYNAETGRIEISRSFFEESSKWMQPPPDTMAIDVPPPSVIHQPELQN